MTLYTPPGQHEPQDQRALAGRRDVLVYATAPLTRPVEVAGPITVKLWAASSATDTDFVVKLLDVWPDGFFQELCHGIVRARYRDGFEQPSLLKAGDIYEYTIPVNPTSNLFRPGHRIRVDVSSSDFPNFDRNHNTGGNDYFESTLLTARQRIFHDPMRPSRIILPVIPEECAAVTVRTHDRGQSHSRPLPEVFEFVVRDSHSRTKWRRWAGAGWSSNAVRLCSTQRLLVNSI